MAEYAYDPRISKIFYYFEKHTNIASGRTVGRKIGLVQEILCKKLILQSQKVRDSVIFEPKVKGHSGATHKVEFVLFQPLKCLVMPQGVPAEIVPGLNVMVKKITGDKVQLQLETSAKQVTATVQAGHALVNKEGKSLAADALIRIPEITADGVRLVALDIFKPIASIESKRVGAQRFSGSDKLGSGIQSIEKAKQASLVAIDYDLAFNPLLLTQGEHSRERVFRSFAILGNGVHWTDHDLRILETYIDYTYLAADEAIIRYADYVRKIAEQKGQDFFKFFMAYFNGMTKTPADSFTVSASDFVPLRPKADCSKATAAERRRLGSPLLNINGHPQLRAALAP